MAEAAWSLLREKMGARLAEGVPLARLTTLGVGGPARILARPESSAELTEVLQVARAEGLRVFVLGLGSNILFADAGFDGLVLKLGRSFAVLERHEETRVRVGAAAPCAEVVRRSVEWALSGLECLAGIPSTVGGAVFMNAGSFGGEIGPSVTRVSYLDRDGNPGELSLDQLNFTYRRFRGLPEGAVMTGAELSLTPAGPGVVAARVEANLSGRRAKQPQGVRSAGSVFKNPPGDSAGRLIEECGFKGFRLGGAQVSGVHANFIINQGQAASRDILELMKRITDSVREKTGITLEPEIRIVAP